MNSFNAYQFNKLQAQLVVRLLAQNFLTELKHAANPRLANQKRRTVSTPSDPAVVVGLSAEAKEILLYKKAPYI